MKKKQAEVKPTKGGGLRCGCGGKLSYVAGTGMRCLKCGAISK